MMSVTLLTLKIRLLTFEVVKKFYKKMAIYPEKLKSIVKTVAGEVDRI